jgi:P2-related tail formation protein
MGLHFTFYPSPSKMKWTITQRQNVRGPTFIQTFFVVSVHRIRSESGAVNFRNISYMSIYIKVCNWWQRDRGAVYFRNTLYMNV